MFFSGVPQFRTHVPLFALYAFHNNKRFLFLNGKATFQDAAQCSKDQWVTLVGTSKEKDFHRRRREQ